MSQVDDWSDGYTSDYLRNLNTYGPASADVPRPSSIVSRQVQYQPPVAQTGVQTEAKTNDTPLYGNAGGFNPGPQRLVSAPARPFRGNATAAQRAARPKPAGKKKTQSASKQQTQPEYRTGGARTPEENEITRSAAEHRTGVDLVELSSQALDAAERFLPALKLLGFGAGAGSADTASPDRPSYMGAAGTMADNFARTLPQPSADSRQPAPESSSTGGQFKNMPWYEDAKAHHEAVKKNMDDYGSALGALKSTWDDIPWWTKLVMLPPVFKAGSPAAGASAAGNVWAEGGRAAAGDAAAGAGGRSFGFDLSAEDIAAANAANAVARQQAIDLSEMRSVLMRSGMPDREIEAYMHRAGFYNDPEVLRQAIGVIHKYGMSGLFENSAAHAAAAARAGSAAGTGAGSAAGEQAASREAIVAARDAAVAQLDPQLQAALANVRKSLANHNISPRQVLHELGSPTASDKDYYEIGRVFFEVDRKTHGAGLSPAERAVANAYVKSYEARLTQGFTRAGRGLVHFIDEKSAKAMIDSIKKNGTVIKKDGTVDVNSLEYIRGLARRSNLTPESQALVDVARSAGLIP